MLRRVLCLLLAFGLAPAADIVAFTIGANAAVVADVFVSPTGNDAWTGQYPSPNGTAGPVATLHRAKQIIAAKLAASGGGARDWTVMFRGGTYYLPAREVFTLADSGGPGHTVTYTSYPGESAVISGGKVLTGFTVNGATWTLKIPEVQAGAWYFGEMWVNDNRSQWPIRPVRGGDRFHVAAQVALTGAASTKPFFPADPVRPVNAGDRYNQSGGNRFGFNAGELNAAWTNFMDVRIEVSQPSANATIIPLASVDMNARVATMNSHTLNDPLAVGAPWRRLNVYEDLGPVPGEMYLNRTTGVLTYVPRAGETPANSTVIAPVLNNLILISNGSSYGKTGSLVGNLKFTGLTFAHTNSSIYSKTADVSGNVGGYIGAVSNIYGTPVGALTTVGAATVTFDNVTLAHLGEAGIVFGPGSSANTFSNSIAHDLGSAALIAGYEPSVFNNFRYLGGEAPSTPATNVGRTTVYNNLIYDFGALYKGCAGIAVGRGAFNRVSHNEIHDGPSFGLILGSDPGTNTDALTHDNYVGYNHIYRTGYDAGVAGGSSAGDFGGLYTVGPQQGTGTQSGTILEYNKIHDIAASAFPITLNGLINPSGIDASGIYNDDRSSGLTIRSNLVYNVSNHMHVLKGMHHTVYNNIFYSMFNIDGYGNRGYYPILNAPPLVAGELQVNYYNNIIAWGTIGSAAGSPQADVYVSKTNMLSDKNLFFQYGATLTNYSQQGGVSFSAWNLLGRDVHSAVNRDPGFKNPSAGDFSLASGSPALSLGFVPINNLSTSGRQ